MWLTLRAAREHAFRAGWAPAYLQHLARGRRPDGSCGHVFFGVSIFFCGSTHLLPVQVQPFFPQSVAGFDGSTQILPFQVPPFFRQSTAGFDGSTHLLPVQVHPFFLQSSAGLEGSRARRTSCRSRSSPSCGSLKPGPMARCSALPSTSNPSCGNPRLGPKLSRSVGWRLARSRAGRRTGRRRCGIHSVPVGRPGLAL